MSKIIEFDKKHVARDGKVEITRGDDISLMALIVQESGNYKEILNLKDLGYQSASAYFKNDSTVETAVISEIDLNTCPQLNISVPASGSQRLALAPQGCDMYMVLINAEGGEETIYTQNQDIAVIDRGFQRY